MRQLECGLTIEHEEGSGKGSYCHAQDCCLHDPMPAPFTAAHPSAIVASAAAVRQSHPRSLLRRLRKEQRQRDAAVWAQAEVEQKRMEAAEAEVEGTLAVQALGPSSKDAPEQRTLRPALQQQQASAVEEEEDAARAARQTELRRRVMH